MHSPSLPHQRTHDARAGGEKLSGEEAWKFFDNFDEDIFEGWDDAKHARFKARWEAWGVGHVEAMAALAQETKDATAEAVAALAKGAAPGATPGKPEEGEEEEEEDVVVVDEEEKKHDGGSDSDDKPLAS